MSVIKQRGTGDGQKKTIPDVSLVQDLKQQTTQDWSKQDSQGDSFSW